MIGEKPNLRVRVAVLSAALACVCLTVVACSIPRQSHHFCTASSQRLIEIAWRAERADCPSRNDCEFQVGEDRKGRCYVQVNFPGELTGNFVTLIIAEDGHIVERIPGI